METRQSSRTEIELPGRFFTGLAEAIDVQLKDVSEGGCRFATGEHALTIGSHVQIFIAGTGPYHANV